MAIKPILFNTEMVCAILDGRKDATRRIVKGFIPDDAVWGYTAFTPKGYISCRGTFADGYGEKFFKLPCEPGDILYVRETWHKYTKRIGKGESCRLAEFCGYKASVTNSEDAEEPWHPSIHMPKEAARIWLKVIDVRVERLQEKMSCLCRLREQKRCCMYGKVHFSECAHLHDKRYIVSLYKHSKRMQLCILNGYLTSYHLSVKAVCHQKQLSLYSLEHRCMVLYPIIFNQDFIYLV